MRPLLRPEPALTLALLRVVVAGLMPLAPGFREGARIARWAPARWIAPRGWDGSFATCRSMACWRRRPTLAVAFAALCAIVGVRARLWFVVLTVAGFYLFALGQLAGHVWHDNHLLWLCGLLAASPCADVLAVDASRPLGVEAAEEEGAPAREHSYVCCGACWHARTSSGTAPRSARAAGGGGGSWPGFRSICRTAVPTAVSP